MIYLSPCLNFTSSPIFRFFHISKLKQRFIFHPVLISQATLWHKTSWEALRSSNTSFATHRGHPCGSRNHRYLLFLFVFHCGLGRAGAGPGRPGWPRRPFRRPGGARGRSRTSPATRRGHLSRPRRLSKIPQFYLLNLHTPSACHVKTRFSKIFLN